MKDSGLLWLTTSHTYSMVWTCLDGMEMTACRFFLSSDYIFRETRDYWEDLSRLPNGIILASVTYATTKCQLYPRTMVCS